MHPALDLRVWLPVALAAAMFVPRMTPVPPAVAADAAAGTTLPTIRGLPPATTEQHYELDAAASTVRFHATGPRGELLVACTGLRGELHLPAGGQGGTFELHLDLGSLQTLTADAGSFDLAHVLGVHRGSELSYRADLVATTSTDLPGVTQRTWLGLLRFGVRAVRQPMQLWQCSLPGQPLRLQGHGTVAGDDYGLPRRHLLGVYTEHAAVTLGLDLVWRRRRAK
ncbi:MAG: hypothetical protein MUC36_12970 [Planctomycetes bacterium]|jgi:hypothetical protein|nr:hypothetical protein [Planctomycetota bacterium]